MNEERSAVSEERWYVNAPWSTTWSLGTAALSVLAGRQENSTGHYGPLAPSEHACAPGDLLLPRPALPARASRTLVYVDSKC